MINPEKADRIDIMIAEGADRVEFRRPEEIERYLKEYFEGKKVSVTFNPEDELPETRSLDVRFINRTPTDYILIIGEDPQSSFDIYPGQVVIPDGPNAIEVHDSKLVFDSETKTNSHVQFVVLRMALQE